MKIEYKEYKDKLFEILLTEDQSNGFLGLIDQLYNQGQTKAEIYALFLELHQEIQVDPRTKEDECVYDRLSDFMDGFSAWGKSFRILPNKPDL